MRRKGRTYLLTVLLAAAFAVATYLLSFSNTVQAQESSEETTQEIQTIEGEEEHTDTSDLLTTDSDTLFRNYVEQQFAVPEISSKKIRKAPRSNRLSGQNLTVYNALKEAITEIANGKRDSTVAEIPVRNLLDKLSYTAEELEEETGSADQEVWEDAVWAKLNYEPGTVLDALVNDLPYDLYWFDVTAGETSYKSGLSSYYTTDRNGNTTLTKYCFSEDAVVRFEFFVSADYSQTGKTETTDVDTTKTSAASTAAAYAKTIAEEADGMSDAKALSYFKEQICDLVSYNDAAAEETDPVYGDPWQLINVFDKDPDTNVVCEGYSKAFKYLCDLHTFNDGKLDVYTVTGKLSYGTGAGAHMWNVVQKSTGVYLADVTNSDTGTAGQDGTLFMAKASNYSYATAESGSTIVTGYVMKTGDSSDISYVYDSDTLADYDQTELKILLSTDADKYLVSAGNMEHGTVSTDEEAKEAGAQVTLTVSPAEGYTLDTLAVTDEEKAEVPLTKTTDTTYTFTMPDRLVTVSATFQTISGATTETEATTTEAPAAKTSTSAPTTAAQKTQTTSATQPAAASTKASTSTTQSPVSRANGVPANMATAAKADKVLTASKKDEVPGTAYSLLQSKSSAQTNKSVKLRWKKVKGATAYIVYANKSGSANHFRKLSQTKKAGLNVKKAAGKKLAKGSYYKFVVLAVDGGGNVLASSGTLYVATKGGKVGNYKSVKITSRKKVTLRKGKTSKIKAKAVAASGKLKVKKHRGLKYESSNTNVATVSSSGKIRAKKKGACTIYVYAQNGVCNSVKVTVK